MFIELDTSANKAKHSDSFCVTASPPLQSCACWQRCADEKKQKSAYTFPHNLWLQ